MEQNNLRILNWYIKKYKNVYLLCGDNYWYNYCDKPIYRFEILGILKILKDIKCGYQFETIDNRNNNRIVNCRYDLRDTYFKIPKLPDIFDRENTVIYLADDYVTTIFEDKNNKQKIIEDKNE